MINLSKTKKNKNKNKKQQFENVLTHYNRQYIYNI